MTPICVNMCQIVFVHSIPLRPCKLLPNKNKTKNIISSLFSISPRIYRFPPIMGFQHYLTNLADEQVSRKLESPEQGYSSLAPSSNEEDLRRAEREGHLPRRIRVNSFCPRRWWSKSRHVPGTLFTTELSHPT